MRLFAIAGLFLFLVVRPSFAGDCVSWWPEQQAPDTVLLCGKPAGLPEANLAMSISGNVARALNGGLTGEGVWIDVPNGNYRGYLASIVRKTGAERQNDVYDVWELLSRYAEKGIVEGYVLYDINEPETVSIATVRASVLNAVLADKSIEHKVRQTGLPLLYNACNGITQRENFLELRQYLDNSHLVLVSPEIPNNRDFAIAYRSMVYYGVDSLLNEILEWTRPLSPVIGWNCGPESGHIIPCSMYGLINTVSDYCYNLPMLLCSPKDSSSGRSFRTTDPRKIRWNSRKRGFHSFLLSDGDNMQWTLGNFIDNDEYWASPFSRMIPMSYTSCAVNLSMAARDPLEMLVRTQPARSSVVEYMGGYYYPDLFAVKRPDRTGLLTEFAKIINSRIRETGINVFGFICMDLYSRGAMEAYEIFARELTGIVGMAAIQYSPYNGGAGDVFWVRNAEGYEIPVCTAKYQIWANLPIPGSGSPQQIAGYINDDAGNGSQPAFGFTIVHAWSRFGRNPDGSIAELDQKSRDGRRGVDPVFWGTDFIDRKTEIVPIDELLWRMRMAHDPSATRKAILEAAH